jgi:hypothetical protein
VALNGAPARYAVRDTSAGRQVLVPAACGGRTWQVRVIAA